MRPPRAQHVLVMGSHSPSVQQEEPQTNSRLQQPLLVHDWPSPQQRPPPADATGQHAPLMQVKPSAQHSEPHTRAAGQQRLRWQPSHGWQHSMPQRVPKHSARERRGGGAVGRKPARGAQAPDPAHGGAPAARRVQRKGAPLTVLAGVVVAQAARKVRRQADQRARGAVPGRRRRLLRAVPCRLCRRQLRLLLLLLLLRLGLLLLLAAPLYRRQAPQRLLRERHQAHRERGERQARACVL